MVQSGSFSQLLGKPIERVDISGKSLISLAIAFVNLEFGTMLCSIYAR